MWTLIALLLGFGHVAFALVYLYLTWYHSYWEKRGLVTAKPIKLLGSYPSLFGGAGNLTADIGKIYNKYKGQHRAVGTFLTRVPQILVLDPQLAHEVLVENFSDYRDTLSSSYVAHSKDYDKYAARNPFFTAGDAWKKRRTDAGAGLTPNKLKQAFPIWQQTGQKLLDYIGRSIEKRSSNVIGTKDLSYRITLQAMCDFIWGIDAGSLSGGVDEVTQIHRVTMDWLSHIFQSITQFRKTPIAPIVRRLFRMRFFSQESNEYYLKLTQNAAERRQAGGGASRKDFLSYLLQLQEKGASLDDMVGHALTLLVDGFETTADVLYHFLYTLGEYQEQQDKLRTEILDALADNKDITYEQLNSLPYLDQCVQESMRLTSIIGSLTKICTRHTTIDLGNDKFLNVEPGTTVSIPTHNFHHDETYFPQPMEFKPERFDNGAASDFIKRGCLLPFGDGPRICLGMRLGLLTIKMAVMSILSEYKIERTANVSTTSETAVLGIHLDGNVDLHYIKLNK